MANDNETDFEGWSSKLCELLDLVGRTDTLQELRLMNVEAAFTKLEDMKTEFQRAFVNRQQHKGVESNQTIESLTNTIERFEEIRNELKEMRHRVFLEAPEDDN